MLTDADGKTLKALPAPRKDDDEEQAKAAKKAFSAAKAELKKFAGMQTTRLYEAMCTQRTWTVADWQAYLMGHPLMKFLCQRLVWAAEGGEEGRGDGGKEGRGEGEKDGRGDTETRRRGDPGVSASPCLRVSASSLTFRPLDDGTFTDYEDNAVQLPADAKIRIAHSCQVPAETASAWACAPGRLQRFAAVHAVWPRDLRLAR